MKNLILCSALIFSSSIFAQTYQSQQKAVIRTDKYEGKIEMMTLKDLTQKGCFEGLHFKIVKGKDNNPICFDNADEDLKIRAATTYFHLTKAREFYVNELKSDYVKSIPQMTIRVDITSQFNELGHFGNDNIVPEYNNALTMPAGRGFPSRGIEPWGVEIWFRPAKKIHIDELNARSSMQDFQVLFQSFRNQTHMTTFQKFIASIVQGQVPMDNITNIINFSIRTVGSSLVMEAFYQASEPLNKLLSRKWYRLDTAMIPEIIYHEYSHLALSDHLVLTHSTAVNEGMADYFAGVIANSSKLAEKIKQYNTFSGKNAKNKKQFMIQFETTDYANTDFVFGLLWDLRRILGEKEATKFIYALRTAVSTNSSIRVELIDGILATCEEVCENPFVDKISILHQLSLRGL